jgi:hypothetical protein
MYSVLIPHAAEGRQVSAEDPVATAPIRLGVLGLDPSITLSNFGIDTNVFNSVHTAERDFTFTLSPGTEMWLRTGRGLLTVTGSVGLTYFQEFETERSISSNARAVYAYRFNRFQPFVSASSLNAKDRPGYEIDVRARRYETAFSGGADISVLSKSAARIAFTHLEYTFAGDAVFGGRPLNQEFNRRQSTVDLSWRQRLTALTTWVTRVSSERERFDFESGRNSDSVRVVSGFELGRFALIRGTAFVGYRQLASAGGGVIPRFSGITADVSVAYTAPTQTRLAVDVQRDLEYSYDVRTPYYIQTSWTATLTQRVIGRWDLQVTGGRDRLSYQALDAANERKDFIGRFGGGIGYTLGDQMRAGFDVASFYRRSNILDREYGAVRAGFSVTYGF